MQPWSGEVGAGKGSNITTIDNERNEVACRPAVPESAKEYAKVSPHPS